VRGVPPFFYSKSKNKQRAARTIRDIREQFPAFMNKALDEVSCARQPSASSSAIRLRSAIASPAPLPAARIARSSVENSMPLAA
jgi:hypothetical protein